jgi:hypothetical protein
MTCPQKSRRLGKCHEDLDKARSSRAGSRPRGYLVSAGRDRPHLTIDHKQSFRAVVDELGGRSFFASSPLDILAKFARCLFGVMRVNALSLGPAIVDSQVRLPTFEAKVATERQFGQLPRRT